MNTLHKIEGLAALKLCSCNSLQSDNLDALAISRVKLLNCDMSENDVAYSVSDYACGKDESPFLRLNKFPDFDKDFGASTSGGWTGSEASSATRGEWRKGANVRHLKNRDLSSDANLPPEITSAIDFHTPTFLGNGASTTYLYNQNLSIVPFAGRQVRIHYDFWARRNEGTESVSGSRIDMGWRYSPVITFSTEVCAAWPIGVWTHIIGSVDYSVPYDASAYANMPMGVAIRGSTNGNLPEGVDYFASLANLRVWFECAEVSTDDIASGIQLKDRSFYGNHLTITNALPSKSREVYTMFEKMVWTAAGTKYFLSAIQKSLPENCRFNAMLISDTACTVSLKNGAGVEYASVELAANVATDAGTFINQTDGFLTLTPSTQTATIKTNIEVRR